MIPAPLRHAVGPLLEVALTCAAWYLTIEDRDRAERWFAIAWQLIADNDGYPTE